MGCGKSKQVKIEEKKQGFLITIIHPTTKQEHYFKYFDEKQKTDLMMHVMNGLCFSQKVSDKCEGSFISKYDQTDDRFHYFVQKLMGIEIEYPDDPLKGKIWVPYINEKKYDWDWLVENNHRVSINDQIIWKLEQAKKAEIKK